MMDHEFRAGEDRFEPQAPDMETLRRAQESWSCMVATRTGGQGKTLVSQLLYEALRDSGVPAKLASVDTDGRAGERSKLGLLYPDVRELAIGADLADVMRSGGMEAVTHWDTFEQLLRERNIVIDVGANVIGSLLRWAKITSPAELIRGRPMNMLIVVTAQEKSAIDAMTTLSEIEATRGEMDIGRVGVVMNEVHGKVDRPGEHMAALQRMVAEKGYPVIGVAKGWAQAVDEGVSLSRLRTMKWEDYRKVRGHEFDTAASRELKFAKLWVDEAIAALRQAGFAPTKA